MSTRRRRSIYGISTITAGTGCTSPPSLASGRRSSPDSAVCASIRPAVGSPRSFLDLITRLSFTVQWRGLRPRKSTSSRAGPTYGLRDRTDSTLAFRHHGEEVTVTAGKPVTAPISKRPPLLPPPRRNPPGREPLHECESQTSRGRKKVSSTKVPASSWKATDHRRRAQSVGRGRATPDPVWPHARSRASSGNGSPG